MELIEVSDQNFLQMGGCTTFGHGQNFILQGFGGPTTTAQFVNGPGTTGPFEVVEEIPTTTRARVDTRSGFVQMVEPSPVVSYIMGADGGLIPVYESIPFDNTVTIVTGAPEPDTEHRVPSHILDHMYAKKVKDPGTAPPSKPRKRAKKKELPPPAVNEFVLPPEIISPSTPKVNIIRKGVTANILQTAFRSLISSRPKILQNTKVSVNKTSQGSGPSAISDLTPTQSVSASSPVPLTTVATSLTNESVRINLNSKSRIRQRVSSSSPSEGNPPIFFLPTTSGDSSDSVGSLAGAKPSFIVTTNPYGSELEENEVKKEPMRVVMSTPTIDDHVPKTELNSMYPLSGSVTAAGQVRSFHLNSDGTLSAISSDADTPMVAYSTTGIGQQEPEVDQPQVDSYNEFPVCTFAENMAESNEASVHTVQRRGPRGSFRLGDKQIFFSYV